MEEMSKAERLQMKSSYETVSSIPQMLRSPTFGQGRENQESSESQHRLKSSESLGKLPDNPSHLERHVHRPTIGRRMRRPYFLQRRARRPQQSGHGTGI